MDERIIQADEEMDTTIQSIALRSHKMKAEELDR